MPEQEHVPVKTELSYVVGIGASAGGLEALQEFFQQIPADTQMAFVVIQHLSSEYKSVMDELLQKHTSMPVKVVESDILIRPNHVYLISSRSNLIVEKDKLLVLEKDPHQRLNLPIDLFFHSLGETYHERAVGIVLSGTGTDGSRGAKTIKENEGLVMVQTPEEARFDGMPNAIVSQGIADFMLSSRELANELSRMAYHAPWLKDGLEQSSDQLISIDSHLLKRILVEVKKQSKIDFTVYREQTITRRLQKRIRVLNLFTLEDYYYYLMSHLDEPAKLAREFLIGVTRFFRDSEAWELLKEQVLPQICEKREPDQPLRIWVACCSSGEEAYSVAILVHEFLSEQRLSLDFKVFATDVDEAAIVFAGQGRYPESVFTSIRNERLIRYFEKDGDSYVIKKLIRDHIVFARHNLLTDPPFLKQDLITCRNMLLYIQPESQRKILSTLHFALRLGGFLFLGKSESLGSVSRLFRVINMHLNIFQNIEAAKTHQLLLDNPQLGERSEARPPLVTADSAVASRPLALDKRFYENALLAEYVPTILFVNHQGDVLYAHGNTHPYIMFPRGRVTYGLKAMLNEQEYTLIQSGIQRAGFSRQTIEYQSVPLERGRESLNVNLSIRPLWHPELEQDIFLVEFKPAESLQRDVIRVEGSDLMQEQLTALRLELQEKTSQLQVLREKLETSNEELQASNEELLASNEELQSTNEELQSVNEELYTVNSELEAKLRTLAELNNDLNNFLNSTQIGLIFLDKELNIRRFTPSVRQVFNLYEGDIGRSLSHFTMRFDQHFDLDQIAHQVLSEAKVYEQEVSVGGEQEFILRVLPYITVDKRVEGIVLSLVNMTELNQVRRKAIILDERYQTIFDNMPDYITLTDSHAQIRLMNQRFSSKQAEKALGQSVSVIFGGEPADYLQAIERARENKAVTITTVLKYDGRSCHFAHRICLLPSVQGHSEEPEIIMVTRDVTELREYQQRLQDEALKLQGLIDSSTDLIAALAPDYRLLVANRAFKDFIKQWFGIDPAMDIGTDSGTDQVSELNQKSLFELLPQQTPTQRGLYQKFSELWRQALGGQTYQVEEVLELPDGSAPIYQLRVARLMAFNGEHLGAVMIMRNVSAERRSEQRLHLAMDELKRTNSYLDSFVYAAAHDLRTPIANLISIIERMQQRPQIAQEPMFELLERSVQSLDQTLGGLIEIIDVQKMSEISAKSLSLPKMLNTILHNYPQLQNGEIGSLEMNLKVDKIYYIEAYLNSIIQNLLDNAVKYRSLSRKLIIQIDTWRNPDGIIQLTIRDNGQGLPPQLAKDKLFQAFKRYNKQVEGKGIGLYLVKTLVEKNGGWVDVEAQPEGGAAFLLGLKEYARPNSVN